MPTIERLDDATPFDRDDIVAPLSAFSRSQGFVWESNPLVLALRDEPGRIVGGAIGQTSWGWLHVNILAVAAELRGQGWGTRLMVEMERIAGERGCHHAWLDTFQWQARPFYERLGYTVFGTLPNYPADQDRYFLAKSLGG